MWFAPDYYRKDGITYTLGWFVGYFQGDIALVGPVAGTLTPAAASLSMRVAPALQGTAEYTLRGYSPSGKLVKSVSLVVTQDEQDPAMDGWGYFTMDLGNLTESVKYLTLENRFVRITYPQNRVIELGVSSITYTAPRH